MFSVGNGVSSAEAWFSTELDVEEVLSGAPDDQLHVLVADVTKSLTRLVGLFLTVRLAVLVCFSGLGRFSSLITLRLG